MVTLTDSFLSDLNDLSYIDDDNGAESIGEEEVDRELVDSVSLNYNDDEVSKVQKSQRYHEIMHKVRDALLQKGCDIIVPDPGIVLEADNLKHQFVVDCIALLVEIGDEISMIHNFIRNKYRSKFPELESIVQHPVDYASVVKKIGNETDLTTVVDLEGLLPSAIIMVVTLTASTTRGKPLPVDVLRETVEACDRVIELVTARTKVLELVESRMVCIAPNLSALVGSAVAGKLMVIAGGLEALAKMHDPSNVQLLGAKKRKNLAGFSTQFPVGCIEQTEIFQSTPPQLKMRACRLLGAKVILAARVDYTRGDITGKIGRAYLEDIRKKIDKWQELPPPKILQPLLALDSKPKNKRGGRRLRKMKERYGITPIRKLCNRVKFGVPEESSLGDGLGEGYGMLGRVGSRKSRMFCYSK